MTPETGTRNVLSIASLLADCGVLAKEDVSAVTATAAHQDLTVGEYLHKNDLVPAQCIRAAIICHLLIRRKLLKYSTAIEALKLTVQLSNVVVLQS